LQRTLKREFKELEVVEGEANRSVTTPPLPFVCSVHSHPPRRRKKKVRVRPSSSFSLTRVSFGAGLKRVSIDSGFEGGLALLHRGIRRPGKWRKSGGRGERVRPFLLSFFLPPDPGSRVYRAQDRGRVFRSRTQTQDKKAPFFFPALPFPLLPPSVFFPSSPFGGIWVERGGRGRGTRGKGF